MKLTFGEKIFQIFNHIFLTMIGFITLYPFWDVIKLSVSTPKEAASMIFSLWPRETTLEGYYFVLKNEYIWNGYLNTFERVVLGVAVQIVMMVLFAYPLSRKDLPFRKPVTLFVVFTMFFGGGLIPEYLLIQQLGLYDTIWALVLPSAIPTYSMLIMRNYFMSLPAELEESARIDGASELRTVVNIIMPLSVPILATVGMWGLVGHWNAWFDSLIYIADPKKYVLQAVLRRIIIEAAPSFNPSEIYNESSQSNMLEIVKAATIIVATVPVMCVYPFLQKYFMKGILVGSLKG